MEGRKLFRARLGAIRLMTWFRLDDSFHSHPKVLRAGNEAVGLYVRCGTYASDHTTDGFVERSIVLLYGTEALAARLVDAGLWHRTRGGWNIHDYLDYNPSREAVEKERKDKAERQKRWREKQSRRVTGASSNASGDAAPTRPAPKEAGRPRATPSAHEARGAANGRASPSGSPARGGKPKPPWCGECNELTRITDGDNPQRCPRCHPLIGENGAAPVGRHARKDDP